MRMLVVCRSMSLRAETLLNTQEPKLTGEYFILLEDD